MVQDIRPRPGPFALLLAGTLLAGCGGEGAPAPPLPEVGIVTVAPIAMPNVVEVPGRLQAVRTAEVRARVTGIVQRRLYREGTDVRAGQALFTIDPRELRAQASAAEATLARAEATRANAAQDVSRYQGLVADRAISQQEYDLAVARLRTAEADVAQARAQVDAARLNLSYTTVDAPISGRAGRAEVTEGAYVSAANATLLTRIEQLDPIYANFSQSTSALLELRREAVAGEITRPDLRRAPAELILEDGSTYPHEGHLNFFDLSVDEATGTTALRAEFPNPDRLLLPGQFVRVQLRAGIRPEAVLLPQRAVTVSPQGATVLVVGPDDVLESRAVTTGALQGASWLILDGLHAGDRVVVDGLQKVRAGATVKVVPDTLADSAAAAR